MDYDLSYIDKYINGQLSSEELAKFEKELITNAELRKDLDTYRDMLDFGKDTTRIEQAIAVKDEIHQEFIYQQPPTKLSRPNHAQQSSTLRYIWILLGLVLVALLGYFVLSPKVVVEVSPDQYYATYFDPDQISLTSRSEANQEMNAKIASLYNTGQYKETITAIEEVEVTSALSARLGFIKGVSYLGADQDAQAITLLQSLRVEHPDYKSDISWYLGLAYLKMGDIPQAKTALQQIEANSNKYATAQKILSAL